MPNARSAVWSYFKKGNTDTPTDEDPDSICQLCKRAVKNKGGNTSNLMSHLKTNHIMVYATLNKKKKQASSSTDSNVDSNVSNVNSSQPTIMAAMEKRAPLQPGQKRAEEITDAITYYLAKDSVPFNAVDRPGFQRLLNVLEPRYQVPAKSTFSRQRMAKLYDSTRQNVLDMLNGIDFYAATTDMWSSRGMTPYLGFTLHWIDKQWKLISRSLGTTFVPEDHTAKELGDCLDDVLKHWSLDSKKMTAITTDNAANIVKTCRDNNWRNITCFGHNLHLGISNAIAKEPKVSRALGVCRKTVAAFSMSWKRRKALTEAQIREEPGVKPVKLASVGNIILYIYIIIINNKSFANCNCYHHSPLCINKVTWPLTLYIFLIVFG